MHYTDGKHGERRHNTLGSEQMSAEYFINKLIAAKTHFERALDCKHTEFDDLYPFMIENPQLFWYKRYVAWSELLTTVNICADLSIDWKSYFTDNQCNYIQNRVMSSTVLDEWYNKVSI